jgi:GxxExxY protein
LLESTYRRCLLREFELGGLSARHEIPVPVVYKGVDLDCGYRADIIVEDSILLELKSVERVLPIHEAQLITYLKLCRLNVGYLLNFNSPTLRDGMRRLLNGQQSEQ